MNIGIILAAGDGQRFNSSMPKQYLKLNGKETVFYSITEMRKCPSVDSIFLVVDEKEYESGYIAKKYDIGYILGGKTRNESIYNAIRFVKEKFGEKGINLLFHDSVRPFVKADLFEEYLRIKQNYDCVSAGHEIYDSLADVDGRFVDRKSLRLIQTPEVAGIDVLLKYFNPRGTETAIIHQLCGKCKTYIKSNNDFNFKITYPEELFLAEQFVRLNFLNYEHKYEPVNTDGLKNVLLLGASGGIGGMVKDFFTASGLKCMAPSHKELDLKNLTVEKIVDYTEGITPDAIINAAACYVDDTVSLTESFEDIFAVNVKANLVLIEYAKSRLQKMNLVFISSSSSTMGRKNLTNYSASKAALNSIIESQAESLAEMGIFLNAVIPEKVKTPLIEKLHKAQINERELLNPQDLLNAIVYFSTTEDYGKLVHIRKGFIN